MPPRPGSVLLSWLPVLSAAAPAATRGVCYQKINLSVYDWTWSSSVVQKHDLPGRGAPGALLDPLLALALLRNYCAEWELSHSRFADGEAKAHIHSFTFIHSFFY